MAKARAIQQHFMPLSSRKEGKPRRRSRALESIEPVAVNARIASKNCRQFLPAHAFYRIAPNAFHLTNDAHEPHLPVSYCLLERYGQVARSPLLSASGAARAWLVPICKALLALGRQCLHTAPTTPA